MYNLVNSCNRMILRCSLLLRPLRKQQHCLLQRQHASTGQRAKYDVTVFGELRVRTGRACNVLIRPDLSLDQNVAFVDHGAKCLPLTVEYAKSCLTVRNNEGDMEGTERQTRKQTKGHVQGQTTGESETCSIDVPVKYNLDVKVGGKCNVSFENFHNDSINVETEHGACTFRKLLTGAITVRSKGGDIISEKVLQGNAVLETQGSGTVRMYKPLCQTLAVRTSSGDIAVTSLYADESKFSTRRGSVSIGSAHRSISVDIEEQGNLSVDSLDGRLVASVLSGDVTVYVCRHDGVDISVDEGDIRLKVPDSLETSLELVGSDVSIGEGLNVAELQRTKHESSTKVAGVLRRVGGASKADTAAASVIKARTLSGSITLTVQDWISSIKLQSAATALKEE